MFNGDTSVTGNITLTTYDQLLQKLGGTGDLASYAKNPDFSFSKYTVKVHGDSVVSVK